MLPPERGDGELEEGPEPPRGEDIVDAFDELLLAGREPYERRIDLEELSLYVKQKVTVIDMVCGLDASQRQKLELGGRGELKCLLERVAEHRRAVQTVNASDQTALRELVQVTERLREALRSDPFERNSLLEKVMSRTLTPEQRARCAALDKSERLALVRFQKVQGAFEIAEVRLPATDVGDLSLAQLAESRGLRTLVLDSTRITDAGLKQLADLTELRQLDLGNTRIDGSGLARLARLTALEELDLRETRITSDSLVHLNGFVHLKRLHLEHTPIDDRALVHLSRLTSLKFLFLRGTAITDAGMAEIRKLRNLRQLDLGATVITDAALGHLSGLADLELLDLEGTQVTKAGVAQLARLPLLGHVYLFDTPVTDVGIAELQKVLPNAKLRR